MGYNRCPFRGLGVVASKTGHEILEPSLPSISSDETRAGEECRGLMRRLDDATARFVGGNLNCWPQLFKRWIALSSV